MFGINSGKTEGVIIITHHERVPNVDNKSFGVRTNGVPFSINIHFKAPNIILLKNC